VETPVAIQRYIGTPPNKKQNVPSAAGKRHWTYVPQRVGNPPHWNLRPSTGRWRPGRRPSSGQKLGAPCQSIQNPIL